MPENNKKIAQQLLDAQVAFFVEQLTTDGFQQIVEEEIDHFYTTIDSLTLNDVVSPEQIKQTVQKYAQELKIHGAIPELFGEIAQHLYEHSAHDNNTLSDIVTDEQFNDILKKLVEMEDVRKRAIQKGVSNPIYASLISELLYNGIKDYATDNPVTKKIPGASSMMKLGKNVMNKTAPKLEHVIEQNVKKYIEKNASATLKQSEVFLSNILTNEKIEDIATDMWEKAKQQKLSSFRTVINPEDLQDFLVMGYEYWLAFRKTSYFVYLVDSGVDFFFNKYGDEKLTFILEEVSIEKPMLLDDAMRFAPPILSLLKENGVLAETFRRRLEPFFFSEATLKIL